MSHLLALGAHHPQWQPTVVGAAAACPEGSFPVVIQGEDGTVYYACRSKKTGKYVASGLGVPTSRTQGWSIRTAKSALVGARDAVLGVTSFSDLSLGGKAVVVVFIGLGLAGLWKIGSLIKF